MVKFLIATAPNPTSTFQDPIMAYRTTLNRPPFFSRLAAGLFRSAAGICIMLCAQANPSFADAPRQAPNSRVAMELPESFAPSDRFSGFVDEKSGASFLVVEMPSVAYDEVKAIGEKNDALAQRGIVETKTTPLPGRSGEYVFITGKQKTAAGEYAKYIMVARDNNLTMMITANVPQNAIDANLISSQQIERAFASASVKAEALKGAELFTLTYLGPFKETLSIMGNSKVYSLTGKIPEPGTAKPTQEPVFVISPSVDKAPLDDLKASATNSFRVIGNLNGHEVKSEKDITVGGLKGYEIVGEGDDPRTGTRSGLYVVLLSGTAGGYYVMAGLAPADGMPTYLPEFQKIAMGFEPKAAQ
jgi:hypothetical protein